MRGGFGPGACRYARTRVLPLALGLLPLSGLGLALEAADVSARPVRRLAALACALVAAELLLLPIVRRAGRAAWLLVEGLPSRARPPGHGR